jgi:hypothetical protein
MKPILAFSIAFLASMATATAQQSEYLIPDADGSGGLHNPRQYRQGARLYPAQPRRVGLVHDYKAGRTD